VGEDYHEIGSLDYCICRSAIGTSCKILSAELEIIKIYENGHLSIANCEFKYGSSISSEALGISPLIVSSTRGSCLTVEMTLHAQTSA
jgi:hypothetical protein